MGDVIRGPWPNKMPRNRRHDEWPPTGWKRGGLAGMSDVEARRAERLAMRPKCPVCKVIYPLNVRVPDDRICRRCRQDIEANTAPDDPQLF